MKIKFFCLFIILLVLAIPVKTKAKDSLYKNWMTIKTPYFYIYFPKKLLDKADYLASKGEDIYKNVEELLGWKPFEKPHILLIDNKDFSYHDLDVFPYPVVTLNISSPNPLSFYSSKENDDYLISIFRYELIKLFVETMAKGIDGKLHKVFGNAISPNVLLPDWLKKGIAASFAFDTSLMEKMVIRSMVAENNILSIDKASHTLNQWPYKWASFSLGHDFVNYLIKVYGKKRLMEFFHLHSSGINPLEINIKAEKVFGEKFLLLWDEWRMKKAKEVKKEIQKIKREGLTEIENITNDGEIKSNLKLINNRLYFLSFDKDRGNGIQIFDLKTKRLKFIPTTEKLTGISLYDDKILISREKREDPYHEYNQLFLFSTKRRIKNEVIFKKGIKGFKRLREPDLFNEKRIVAIKSNGDKEYLLLILNDEPFILSAKKPFRRISTPRFSPNGKIIVFSALQNKNWDLWLYCLDKKIFKRLTFNEAKDIHPSWGKGSDRIFFSSDRDHVFNIYSINLKTGRVKKLTNLIGGGFFPAANKDEIYFLNYSFKGWDIAKFKINENNKGITKDEKSGNIEGKDKEGNYKKESAYKYSPYKTLFPPRYLAPDGFISNDDIQIGFKTSGKDVLNRIEYETGFRYGIDANFLNLYIKSKINWDNSSCEIKASRFSLKYEDVIYLPNEEGEYEASNKDFYQKRERLESILSKRIRTSLPFMNYTLFNPYIGIFFENRGNITSIPYNALPIKEGQATGYFLGAFLDNRKKVPRGIGYESGTYLKAEFEQSFPIFGTDFHQRIFTIDMKKYLKIPYNKFRLKKFSHHILAFHLLAGRSWGEDLFPLSSFRVGGSIGEGFITKRSKRSFPLRGFPENSFKGEKAFVLSLEYRFPIMDIYKGKDTFPLFLRDFHVGIFTDFGGVFNNSISINDINMGAGIELRSDIEAFWSVPATIRLGIAYPVIDRSPDKKYNSPILILQMGIPF